MRKTKRIPDWAIGCLAILAFVWAGCSKANSITTVSAVTYLSVIHGAPYTGAATIYFNDTLITQADGIPTGAYSPKYGTIKPGFYAAKFKKAGTDSVLDQVSASRYDSLLFYTLLLYNDPGGRAAHVLKIMDDYSTVTNSTSAYYRFFDLAPDFPSVNVYFNGNLVQSNRSPADIAYNSSFGAFQQVAAGTYDITVKNAKNDSILAKAPTVPIISGKPFTIWITGTSSAKNLSIHALLASY